MRHVLLIALLALAVAAPGAGARAPVEPPETWATVNVCDTLEHPNEMGIRGSMHGMARKTAMYMRFRVQFRRGTEPWHVLKSGPLTDSGWVRVASGRKGAHDAGWSFRFKPPGSGRFFYPRRGFSRRAAAARTCSAAWCSSSGGAAAR